MLLRKLIGCVAMSVLSALTVRLYVSPGVPVSSNLSKLNLPSSGVIVSFIPSSMLSQSESSLDIQFNLPPLFTVIFICFSVLSSTISPSSSWISISI